MSRNAVIASLEDVLVVNTTSGISVVTLLVYKSKDNQHTKTKCIQATYEVH